MTNENLQYTFHSPFLGHHPRMSGKVYHTLQSTSISSYILATNASFVSHFIFIRTSISTSNNFDSVPACRHRTTLSQTRFVFLPLHFLTSTLMTIGQIVHIHLPCFIKNLNHLELFAKPNASNVCLIRYHSMRTKPIVISLSNLFIRCIKIYSYQK